MNAVAEPIAFHIPKKPRVKEKDPPPDQRKVCVLPIRVITDKQVTDGMLRVLALLCSYCNRAGVTWVSQKRLSEDMQVSRQAITKQLHKLTEAGYVEVIRKGFRGERTNTLRVIFDPSVTAEDAIAMTSNKEDTRPPAIKQEQDKQMDEQIDREGLQRIAKLVGSALKQPLKPKEYTMPKTGETMAVKRIKEDIAKAKGTRSHRQPNTVANEPVDNSLKTQSHRQPHRQPNEVAPNTGEHSNKDSIKVINKEEVNKYLESYAQLEVVDVERLLACMTGAQVREGLDTLLPLFAAEGLNPVSHVLADAILQMHRDAR